MKLPIFAMLVVFASGAFAQSQGPWQPLGEVRQFLQLTDAQVQAILTNNGEYNDFARAKQDRISQVRSEIATETAKQPLDPMGLGVRYAEIETICRQLKENATASQKKNQAILSDAQKAKLQVLQEAMKLFPVISDAQSANLVGASVSPQMYFRSGSIAGGVLIGVGGVGSDTACFEPFYGATPPEGAAPNRVSTPPQRWFNPAK